MTDRRDVSGNLPSEFAERVSDPIDFADRLAWERARRRFSTPRREAMPEIKHVKTDVRHFLVVDGTRGPIAYGPNEAAMHPAGYLYFPKAGTKTPEKMRGKLLQVTEIFVPEFEEAVAKDVASAYNAWVAAVNEATARRMSEWPEAK